MTLALLPGWRWLSPVHACAVPAAKARLAALFEDKAHNHEFTHHLLACASFWEVVKFIASPKFEAEVQRAQSEPGGYQVLRAFRHQVPQTFRVVNTTHPLQVGMPHGAPAEGFTLGGGNLVVIDLHDAKYREHRLATCCGQVMVTTIAVALIEALYPGSKVAMCEVVPAYVPPADRIIKPELAAAMEGAVMMDEALAAAAIAAGGGSGGAAAAGAGAGASSVPSADAGAGTRPALAASMPSD